MAIEGKGFFIWKIPRCEDGDINAIANLAERAGLSHVLIKIANGSLAYNIDPHGTDLVPPLVNALNDRNIESWGWHYIYGDDPIGEANKAIQRIRQTGVTTYVIDAEREFKQPGKDRAALQFMNRLRSALPTFPVALSSYRFPSYHPNIPWRTFLAQCDYNMPQVYWQMSHNPSDQLIRSVDEFQSMTPYRPVIPTGSAYKTGNWEASPEEVVAFLDTAKSLNLSTANFWEWSNCRTYIPETWEAIRDYTWFDSPPPLDITQIYINALNSHDVNLLVRLYSPTAVHVNTRRTVHGSPALSVWYQSLFNQVLPDATFTLTNYTGDDNVRHLTWTASTPNGDVQDGADTFALIDDKIAYHYTFFTLTQ